MVAQALGEKVGAFLKVEGHRWGRSGPSPSLRGAPLAVVGLPPRTAGCGRGAGAVAEEGMQQGIPLRLSRRKPGPARGQYHPCTKKRKASLFWRSGGQEQAALPLAGLAGCTDALDHHIGMPAILTVILYFFRFHSTYQHKNLETRQCDIKKWTPRPQNTPISTRNKAK